MSRSLPAAVRAPSAVLLAIAMLLGALVTAPQVEARHSQPDPVRFATFNASLNRGAPGQALADLSAPGERPQAAAVAEIIQRVRPEVLLINEFDYVDGPVTGNAMTDAFQANYLSIGQNGAEPIHYDYVFVAPSNTGIHSGFDLNNYGGVVSTPLAPGYGDDALGFGEFPGQFGMAVFSQHPIDYERARTFQNFLWKDMPAARLPDDVATTGPADWYTPGRAGDPAAVEQEPLGPADPHRQPDRPLPGQPSDAAGLRRRRGPQRPAQLRRDPALGRLHHAAAARRATSTTTQGAAAACSPAPAFVIAGDQNSDPLRRRQHPRRDPAAARQSRASTRS